VFGIYDTLAVGAIALGSALAGGLSDAMGITGALVLACLMTLVLTAVCIAPLQSATRSARTRMESLEPLEDEA
jgi:hypothetical protein